MKKFISTSALSLVLVLGFSIMISAQNLVINGDMESWTGGSPDGWYLVDNISQETTIFYEGTSSARQTSASSAQKLQQNISGIVGGNEYTISYWYLDNDSEAKTRIWSAWLDGGSTMTNHADILHGEYSSNNAAWQQFNVTLEAPEEADGFRFEVRAYNQDGNVGGSVFYDDFIVTGDIVVDPEPTNYPTGFTANASGNTINLNWTDAIGTQLPSAYIIYAGVNSSLPVPVDGTPVTNDSDLSDGSGAINVNYGAEETYFTNLDPNTTYFFSIYPYTNAGAFIDFKTDGTAPTAEATTPNITTITLEYENFDDGWGNWTPISVVGSQEWVVDPQYGYPDPPCAKMTGYEDPSPYENDDWLISPPLDFNNYENEKIIFYTANGYPGPVLEFKVSTDYDGGGDPYSATWTPIPFNWTDDYFVFVESGIVDLSGFIGSEVYVAFQFTSTNSESATWEVDEITITGDEDLVIDPEPSNYPTDFDAIASGASVDLSWIDAIGSQLPDGYIIFAGTSSTLPVPVDGTPIANDPDLSDGEGALNVSFGIESGSFNNLEFNSTYYFSIYSYTNSGNNIDYKNDGTAPTAEATVTPIPEPTNYPTDFNALASGTLINLSWTDAIGSQLPDRYIILAGTSSSLPIPEDGIPIADDPDLLDGSGALNVNYGIELSSFGNLVPGTTYYFSIYPYTNSGVAIDYKSDGTAPTANALTSNTVPVTIEEENFDNSWGNWTREDVLGTNGWERDNNFGPDDSPCALVTGYMGGSPPTYEQNEDWLISPAMDFDDYENEKIVFYNAMNYSGNDMEFKISTDYSGSGDPNLATWTDLSYTMSTGNFDWTNSGEIDLSMYNGNAVYIAFLFTCTDAASATWQVDDIVISGEEEFVIEPEPSNYPTAFLAEATGTSINLSWTDATGSQLPDDYILFAGITPSLPVPVDGTPVPDDTDLSDGAGAINVSFGVEEFNFGGLNPATTYYFSIYPYTNSDVYIDYKSDGTAPTADATTANTITVTIEEENFDDSWGSWTRENVLGTNEWGRDNNWGPDDSPCASVTGYMGGDPPTYAENEDWLISPAMNFDDYDNEKIVFYNAMNYSGNDMEFKISTDYSGSGDPNLATWTNLSYNMSTGDFSWTNSGELDLSMYNGDAVYVAFLFTCTNSGSATWEVDDIVITGEEEFVIQPEPTNYPTDFTSVPAGASVNLSWIDATGDQLPHAYIIFAGTSSSLPTPDDGIPIPDDFDLSDGNGVLNVNFGIEEGSFGGLAPSTTYYFSIYSYTNSGGAIDYKNDGTAPTDEATTGYSPIIEYQNFDNGWEDWTIISTIGSQEWEIDPAHGDPDPPCAYMSGYGGSATENEDWLISPPLNLIDYDEVVLTFNNAVGYTGPTLELKVSTDYDGGGNPNSANWTTLSYNTSPGFFEWVESGEIDLSAYNSSDVYISFYYTSNNSEAPAWEVDEILIMDNALFPEPSNYPTDFIADAAGSSIYLNWTDAVGTNLPQAYVIFAGISATLPVPADGTPVTDDPNLSDGSGAINVNYGVLETSFNNLNPNTTYYFSIYPYSNNGSDIDYKNDGTAPAANATTSNSTITTIEYENFDDNWGNWTRISVIGSQVWSRDNTYGIDYTPCAAMSGYLGGDPPEYEENEDWLISPAMNFNTYLNEQIIFYTARGYSGPDLEFLVSTDYDGGGDPNTATWTNLSFTWSTELFEWTESGIIDLSGFDSNAVYVAFKFTSANSSSATWEVDEITITGEEEYIILPEPSNYPDNYTATGVGLNIDLLWADVTGGQIPSKYVIFAGITDDLPIPEDGVAIQDDSDLSDGIASVNVLYGDESYTFNNGLSPYTTYYFSIYPFNNVGGDIDYKNEGTAPTANAKTTNVVLETLLSEGFDNSWGGWARISVIGAQKWDRDNTYGPGYTPCAAMSGYLGNFEYEENDDWLISPAMNFNNLVNKKIVFDNAKSYNGNDLELLISTDYIYGNEPNTATWSPDIEFEKSTGYFDWVSSGQQDISEFEGDAVHVAFHFTCTSSGSSTWEVDNILITGEKVLGINDFSGLNGAISLYPNPSGGIVNIIKPENSFNTIKITTLTGIQFSELELRETNGRYDLSDLQQGIYFVVFIDEESGQTITKKLVIR